MIYNSKIHRNGCVCKDDDLSWKCAKCGRDCAPCWGGHVNDDHEDICGACSFREDHQLRTKRQMFDGSISSAEAMSEAARSDVGFMPLEAVRVEKGWIVISIDQAILTAWNHGRWKCASGHADGIDMSSRCTSCGEVKPFDE